MTSKFTTYSRESGGRVLLLFLLFLLGLYQLANSGLPAFTAVCMLPFVVLFIYLAFTYRMLTFWILIFINYFLQMKDFPVPVPMSLPNEMLQIILLAIAIIDSRQSPHFERAANPMLFALVIWCSFCTLEILNDTCGLGISVEAWYTGARMLAFQLLYIFLVFSIYISSPEILMKYLKFWAFLSLFSAIWTWKQQNIGFTQTENAFLEKIFFLIVGILVIKSMFASGTRTAVFCIFAGFAVFIVLSKSTKIATTAIILGGLFYVFLAYTHIGHGNQQIRRMRSAFSKSDASANTRNINQETMKKYMKEAPWGIGLGMKGTNVPANNKYNRMATIAADSEYVFIWLRTGTIGITVFVITMLIMLGGACYVVFFRLKSRSLIGIGGGLCSSFVAIQIGGYANQVLLQFPNALIFYGGLSIVYILPYLEPAWIEYENKKLSEQEEKKRLKLEKKLASRV